LIFTGGWEMLCGKFKKAGEKADDLQKTGLPVVLRFGLNEIRKEN
jgi:hypothetical protein